MKGHCHTASRRSISPFLRTHFKLTSLCRPRKWNPWSPERSCSSVTMGAIVWSWTVAPVEVEVCLGPPTWLTQMFAFGLLVEAEKLKHQVKIRLVLASNSPMRRCPRNWTASQYRQALPSLHGPRPLCPSRNGCLCGFPLEWMIFSPLISQKHRIRSVAFSSSHFFLSLCGSLNKNVPHRFILYLNA